MTTSPTKRIKECDYYCDFLAACHTTLSNWAACNRLWPDFTPGTKDLDIPGKLFNYFYHRYFLHFMHRPSMFLHNIRNGDVGNAIIRLYKSYLSDMTVEEIREEFSKAKYAQDLFVYLDIENGISFFYEVFGAEEGRKRFDEFDRLDRAWHRYWKTLSWGDREKIVDFVGDNPADKI